jgi:cell division topological specificity factor
MFEFLSKLFGGFEGSKNRAKERLRLVLVHDRASLSPGLVEALKEDSIQVITKYLEIDEEGLGSQLRQGRRFCGPDRQHPREEREAQHTR